MTPGGMLDLAFTAATTSNDNALATDLAPYLSGTVLNIPGSASGTITLPAGDYYFTGISIDKDITINISGAVNIYLDGPLDVKKTASINATGLPTDLSIYSKSTSPIDFKQESTVNALIYAPAANVTFHKESTIKGSIVASGIDFKKETHLTYDVKMKDKFSGGGGGGSNLPMTIAYWREK